MAKRKNEREAEMLEMRRAGASYTEIAERYGISKQRVYQIVGARNKAYFRPITPERCIYPYLRKWMNDNEISIAELVRRGRGNASATNWCELKAVLTGKARAVTKPTIDKLINATGLTYEKLFYEGEIE